jgi:hypothetical protein
MYFFNKIIRLYGALVIFLPVMVAINEMGWDIFTDIVGTYKNGKL